MDANFVKIVVYEMIKSGDLKFVLDKGECEQTVGEVTYKVPTTVLKVKDSDNSELSISVVLDKDLDIPLDRISFENGSIIEIPKSNSEVVRGSGYFFELD